MLWAFPRFGHPHSQNPNDIFIPCSPNPKLNPNHKGNMRRGFPLSLGFGDAHITVTPESHGGKLGMRLHISTSSFLESLSFVLIGPKMNKIQPLIYYQKCMVCHSLPGRLHIS